MTAPKRKRHTASCCTQFTYGCITHQAPDACAVCDCREKSVRHREPSNLHYHEYVPKVQP